MSRRKVTDYSTFAGDQLGSLAGPRNIRRDPVPDESDRRAYLLWEQRQRENAALLRGVLADGSGS